MPINHANKYAELTDDQFLLIGKIVVEFSNIDFLLGNLLTRLLFTSDFLGRTFTDNMSSGKLQDSIDNAIDIHTRRYGERIIPRSKIEEIKSLNSRITLIRNKRNKFAHYCWSRSTDDEIFGTRLSGKIPTTNNPNKDSMVLSNNEMTEIYKSAYNIVDDLHNLIQTLPIVEEQQIIDQYKNMD